MVPGGATAAGQAGQRCGMDERLVAAPASCGDCVMLRAVMCAVPSAAGRQIRLGTGCEGEHRRDQREAEDEKQDEAESTSHSVIVTSFAGGCVSDPLFALLAT